MSRLSRRASSMAYDTPLYSDMSYRDQFSMLTKIRVLPHQHQYYEEDNYFAMYESCVFDFEHQEGGVRWEPYDSGLTVEANGRKCEVTLEVARAMKDRHDAAPCRFVITERYESIRRAIPFAISGVCWPGGAHEDPRQDDPDPCMIWVFHCKGEIPTPTRNLAY